MHEIKMHEKLILESKTQKITDSGYVSLQCIWRSWEEITKHQEESQSKGHHEQYDSVLFNRIKIA